ncbi:MAG: hypothetical protein LC789_02425 [Actinobacteria bacterium]|nr:hypothetical protein [Actinomycetota bacterium]MCA1720243.1 hypothetical protein [Actinomycetota bacterium]
MTARLLRAAPALLCCWGLVACANVDTDPAGGSAGDPAGDSALAPSTAVVRCVPPPDTLPFAVIAALRAPAKSLRRPFSVTYGSKVLLGADVIDSAGAVISEGAVWVAEDTTGKGLASVNPVAAAASTLPAASAPGADDPAVRQAAQCAKTG